VNVAIVGSGLIGQKRARALNGGRVVACVDIIKERAEALAHPFGADATCEWRDVVGRTDVDAVLVCTTHNALTEVALGAVQAGKHVLVEKPAARRSGELDTLIRAAAERNVKVRVGFNHRFHPAFQKAHEIVNSGAVGELMYIRARYGHGGRAGYEKEWRAAPELSGGGELIDQGVHLIDLARWFLGDFKEVGGFVHTYFWKMPVEDNGFMLLKTDRRQVAFLHASWTEWKNIFSFEIFGRAGKLEINGLGGSYGVERLTHHRMLPQMGPPETTVWEYPGADSSWGVEFGEFERDIRENREPNPGLPDAQQALRVVERIYEASQL
jgi:predicted dehydrogenase